MSMKKLVVPLCAAVALGVAACGSDADSGGGDSTVKQDEGTPAQNTPVTIAFSAPGADHGWMAAITDNARKQADELEGVTLELAEGVTDSAAQADQIETLIASKPDALVVLPNEGDALTPVALKAMAAGIPVVNVDREFAEPGAYRTLITGDNYGIGYEAGKFFADQLKCKRQRGGDPGDRRHLGDRGPLAGLQGRAAAALQGRHQDRRQPARRLPARQGPVGDGEHPAGPEGPRRRLHA